MSTTGSIRPSIARPRWRLSPRGRKTIKVVHIIAAVGLLGEVWVLVALNVYATLTTDTELARSAYRLMGVLVFVGGIPLSMTALLAAITLGIGTRWGLVRHYWVFVKLLLLISVILCGMIFFQPASMADAIERGSLSTAHQWRQVVVVASQLVMLVTATVLAVFKPWGRLRRTRP